MAWRFVHSGGGGRRLRIEQLEDRRLLVFGPLPGGPPAIADELYSGAAGIVVDEEYPELTDCSAALLSTGRHLLTAAHCVHAMSINETRFAVFAGLEDAFPFTRTNDSGTNKVIIHPNWSGLERDGFDIAVLILGEVVPVERYDIYRASDELSIGDIDIVGYGRAGYGGSTPSCSHGFDDGQKRHGKNRFEAFADDLVNPLELGYDIVPIGSQLAFDFDSGSSANDGMGVYLDLNDEVGHGEDEVAYGSGDSGGPNFIDGKIAGITSWGIQDIATDDCYLYPSTFGEFFLPPVCRTFKNGSTVPLTSWRLK